MKIRQLLRKHSPDRAALLLFQHPACPWCWLGAAGWIMAIISVGFALGWVLVQFSITAFFLGERLYSWLMI